MGNHGTLLVGKAEIRRVAIGRGNRRTDPIPFALTVIATSIALGLQPTPAAAEIIPLSVSGSGALTIPGATYNVPDSVMQAVGLQKTISGSQNLGGFFTTPGFCLWAGACIPSTETGASVSANIAGKAGMTLDASLKNSILNYSLGATGQAVVGKTVDATKGTLKLGPATHDNQFNTAQLDAGLGAGITTSLSIGGSARACIVSACTGASGNLFNFTAEQRGILEVVTDGANERIDTKILGLTVLGVDAPFDLATLYFAPPAFNTVGGFVVGSAQAFSSDNTTSDSDTTTHLEDSSRMPTLGVSWNVIPFGKVGIGCCGAVPIIGGELTAASDELVLSIDLVRQDFLDTTLQTFVYFDEPIDLFHNGISKGVIPAGQRIDTAPAPVCVWGAACTPGTDSGTYEFRPAGGGSGILHGHLAPELDGVFRELTSLAPCGTFDITVGELSLTLGGQTFGVGPLYEQSFDLGCLNVAVPLTDQSLRFKVLGAIQHFSVAVPEAGSLWLLGLGVAGLSLIRRRKTGTIPARILPT